MKPQQQALSELQQILEIHKLVPFKDIFEGGEYDNRFIHSLNSKGLGWIPDVMPPVVGYRFNWGNLSDVWNNIRLYGRVQTEWLFFWTAYFGSEYTHHYYNESCRSIDGGFYWIHTADKEFFMALEQSRHW